MEWRSNAIEAAQVAHLWESTTRDSIDYTYNLKQRSIILGVNHTVAFTYFMQFLLNNDFTALNAIWSIWLDFLVSHLDNNKKVTVTDRKIRVTKQALCYFNYLWRDTHLPQKFPQIPADKRTRHAALRALSGKCTVSLK